MLVKSAFFAAFQLFTLSAGASEPRDCADAQLSSERSGESVIYPDGHRSVLVYCDQDTDGGGWTVFQRRKDGSVDFYRDWADYQRGFGKPDGDFWMGLDALNKLTHSGAEYELRVDMINWVSNKTYATYSNFSIADISDNYRLHYDNFTGGSAGDSLYPHNGMKFSTKDVDNDLFPFAGTCAQIYKGGWWYRSCYLANLNGVFQPSIDSPYEGMVWGDYSPTRDLRTVQQFTEMKVRPMKG